MSKLVIMISCAMLVFAGLYCSITQILNTPCSDSKKTKCYIETKFDKKSVDHEVNQDMRIPKIISGIVMVVVGVLLFVTSKKMNKTVMIIASILLVSAGLYTMIIQLLNKPCDYENSKKFMKAGETLGQAAAAAAAAAAAGLPVPSAAAAITNTFTQPKSCVISIKTSSSTIEVQKPMFIPKMISGVMMLIVGVLLFFNSRKRVGTL